jgi:thiol-disulfide isomerase/thioredoxin
MPRRVMRRRVLRRPAMRWRVLRWRVVAAVIAALALTALPACTDGGPPTMPDGEVVAPDDRPDAPELRGELVERAAFDDAGLAGKVVVVNFWASWCGPCWAEADDLEKTYQATKAGGVAFVGINTRDERDAAARFIVGRSTYPNIFDPTGKVALGFAVPPNTIPYTVVIDRQGRIAMVVRRAVVRSFLEPIVTQLAAEAA